MVVKIIRNLSCVSCLFQRQLRAHKIPNYELQVNRLQDIVSTNKYINCNQGSHNNNNSNNNNNNNNNNTKEN